MTCVRAACVCVCACVCRLRGVGVTSVTRQRNPHGGGVAMVSASQESAWSHITAAAYTCVGCARLMITRDKKCFVPTFGVRFLPLIQLPDGDRTLSADRLCPSRFSSLPFLMLSAVGLVYGLAAFTPTRVLNGRSGTPTAHTAHWVVSALAGGWRPEPPAALATELPWPASVSKPPSPT